MIYHEVSQSANPYRCTVLADSVSEAGVRLTTLQIRMPRIVLAEFNTHRMFSRNSASSRAIPVEKRIAAVRSDPFVPEAFGANKRGMQAGDALDNDAQRAAFDAWMGACGLACDAAERLANIGVHKQWANRLIEPFSWHEVIVTATEWENFYALRISEHAQPEIRRAAEAMKAAMDASEPTLVGPGGWHLPLVTNEDRVEFYPEDCASLSAARCARVSYLTHDGKRDPAADLRLAHQLRTNGHMSPFEHPATPMRVAAAGFAGNFRGWTQLRKLIPNEEVFRGPTS